MLPVTRSTLLLLMLLLASARPASAGGSSNSYSTEVSATPTATGVVVEVEAWSGGGTISVGTNPLAGCTIVSRLSGPAVIDYAGGRGILVGITDPSMETSEASYSFVSCPNRIFDGFSWAVWEESDPPPGAVIEALAAAARAAIQVPDLTPQSAPDGLVTPFLTQLPVWLWVPQASWVPVSGTAALPQIGVSVTATATPRTTSWLAGTVHDGATTITCTSGTPWAENLSEADTDCAITFTETTPSGVTIDLRVTTTYDLDVACSPGVCDPATITLPDLAVTAVRPVTITEALGVIVR